MPGASGLRQFRAAPCLADSNSAGGAASGQRTLGRGPILKSQFPEISRNLPASDEVQERHRSVELESAATKCRISYLQVGFAAFSCVPKGMTQTSG